MSENNYKHSKETWGVHYDGSPEAVCRCIHACEEEAWLTGPADSAAPQFCPSRNTPASVPL